MGNDNNRKKNPRELEPAGTQLAHKKSDQFKIRAPLVGGIARYAALVAGYEVRGIAGYEA